MQYWYLDPGREGNQLRQGTLPGIAGRSAYRKEKKSKPETTL